MISSEEAREEEEKRFHGISLTQYLISESCESIAQTPFQERLGLIFQAFFPPITQIDNEAVNENQVKGTFTFQDSSSWKKTAAFSQFCPPVWFVFCKNLCSFTLSYEKSGWMSLAVEKSVVQVGIWRCSAFLEKIEFSSDSVEKENKTGALTIRLYPDQESLGWSFKNVVPLVSSDFKNYGYASMRDQHLNWLASCPWKV